MPIFVSAHNESKTAIFLLNANFQRANVWRVDIMFLK